MFDFLKKKPIKLHRVVDGEIHNLSDVPDAVFSQRLIGDGYAIEPINQGTTCSEILAPVSGELLQVFPTNHAFGIRTAEGLEVLVHVGIDTVSLKGQGFKRLIEIGETVEAGKPILSVDFSFIREMNKPTACIVVITNMELVKKINLVDPKNLDHIALVELK